MTSKELLEEIEAEEELLHRGFTKEECPVCKGGKIKCFDGWHYTTAECACCSGRGFVWQGPITK